MPHLPPPPTRGRPRCKLKVQLKSCGKFCGYFVINYFPPGALTQRAKPPCFMTRSMKHGFRSVGVSVGLVGFMQSYTHTLTVRS